MSPTPSARDRIMDAVLVCVERDGLGNFALEDVATEADLSRATIYRHFAGGRDELVRETVTREVARFWAELATEVAAVADLEGRLVAGLMAANRKVDEHVLLQRLLTSEPEQLLPTLFESDSLVQGVVREYLATLISGEPLQDDVDVLEAADYLSRMLVMHIGSRGRWDLTDAVQVRRLVRTQFLAGIIADSARR
jgi:AcrR family transcriptional regulator